MTDTPASTPPRTDAPALPDYQPQERFWPYVDLTEEPTPEELAALDPDLRTALFGAADIPFSFTLVFPRFAGPDFDAAVQLARASAEYREVGSGEGFRVRARFYAGQATQLRDLFAIVGRYPGCEVLVDDRPVPFARELWLPLTWFLLPR
ncbi:hypothetical protein TBR22_A38850 [Luteitalea sp. TBR-22]|uniref:hypothetical protein n=1 Tax=Luteitalea sp. TBR-22 TaxID=2802971 RepID=UPI001AF7194C|nr:hypothetical protein [Luteitalea sp. TBR-22]BCS34657.1 hypothetical protein TBR22_A38850 [Luteitalea sp. TBR-22]